MTEVIRVGIQYLPEHEGMELPRYMTDQAAGMDLAAAVPGEIVIPPGGRALIATGIAVALPEGVEAQIRPRSGLAIRYGVTLLNAPGTIDADYRGEIKVILINFGEEPFLVKRGDRIAQMVFQRVLQARWEIREYLPPTQRGNGGFGHTSR